jgi:hypothetical protein
MWRALILGVGVLTIAATGAQAATPLDGRWLVDLSTQPDKPYVKVMDLVLADDGSVSGSFYDSTIEAGRWKTARGRTCVSFRTTDGKGPYHTAACLVGDHVEGQTWAEHRNFLFNWNAKRPAE